MSMSTPDRRVAELERIAAQAEAAAERAWAAARHAEASAFAVAVPWWRRLSRHLAGR